MFLFRLCYFIVSFLKSIFVLFLFLTPFLVVAQVSGNVFRDFNANGVKTTAAPDPIEIGLKDVTVNAYDAVGSTYTTTTNATGNYTITSGTGPYRVEFILPPYYYASKGSVSNTNVQFVAAGATANLGVNNPNDYCQANPFMATNMYINGNNSTGTSGSANTLVKFQANDTGTSPTATGIGTAAVMGTTWGLAYQKETGKLFSAAYLKRHAGFGPQGTGGIYVTNVATGVTTSFVNLNGLGTISTGANPHGTLPSDKTQPSKDSLAFYKVGKVALGDIDISDDGKYLFVVNLFTREVHKIFINNPATVPTASNVTTYSIPNPCGNTDYRPFALKYYNGSLYIGVACTAEGSQNRTQLAAYVYEMNPSTGVFSASPVLSSTLDFTRGKAWRPDASSDRWYPWTNTWTGITITGDGTMSYPQPMFTDIEFDVNGDMILGFRDRFGDQLGVYNQYPTGASYSAEVVTGGDIMRATKLGSTWSMESNGVVGSLNSGTANGEGSGGSEFYKGDFFYGGQSSYGHQEICNGGLALLPGSGEIAMTSLDPLTESVGFDGYNAAGIRYLSNTNGAFADGFLIYDTDSAPGTFQKSNGIGDVEFLCNVQPLEIGNRVFTDTNNDGVQDPSEAGIDGITVKLYKAGIEVASTTTSGGGQYIFSNVDANTAYEIKILAANFPSGKILTASNTGSGVAGSAVDMRDNDATLVSNNAVIAYTTGSAGQNNHTLDFGFVSCATITNPSADVVLCVGETASNITVNTSTNTAGSIKFVKFADTDQIAINASPTVGELSTVYAGTAIATVTPTGGSSPYTATYTFVTADFPNTGATDKIYYVYAILTNDASGVCRPVQEIKVTVHPLPSFMLSSSQIMCYGASDGVITVSASGTSPFTYSKDAGVAYQVSNSFTNLAPATYPIWVKDANGCVKKCN